MGASNSEERQGQFLVGAVKRLLGCAPLTGLPSASVMPACQGLPFQSTALAGASSPIPSHQTVLLSRLCTTLVKIVPFFVDKSALGLDFMLVPGATPKKPFSGFSAHSRPSSPTRIQAISSPTHHTL